MDNTIQINGIKRLLGIKFIELGVAQIRAASTLPVEPKSDNSLFLKAAEALGVPLNATDIAYYYTSWDNWQQIINLLNPIAQAFPWEAGKYDCNNRSALMTSLSSLLFEINTCGTTNCEVYDAKTGAFKYGHYANMICDDQGILYLWDVDQGGMFQKVTGNDMIMGVNKYHFNGIRAY